MKRVLGVVAVVAVVAACGRAIPANTIYDDGDQPSTDCSGDAPIEGSVGTNTGAACEDARLDCLEACCHCEGDENGSYWVSECYHGYCAAPHDACQDECNVRAQQ